MSSTYSLSNVSESLWASVTRSVRYHGYHLDPRARFASPNPAERRWSPREKGADIAIATHLLESCLGSDRPDGVILISGDADFKPLVQQVVSLDPPVVVMVSGFKRSLARVYFDPGLTGFAPILLDGLLPHGEKSGMTGMCKKGGTQMSRTEKAHDGDRGVPPGKASAYSPWATQEIGRVVVNLPKRSRLDVYRKRTEGLGATVVCHDDGGRYGVGLKVLSRYATPGTYHGWAFVDLRRAVAFFFAEGDPSAPPPPMVSIHTRGEFVAVKGNREELAGLADGTCVAFRAYLPSRNGARSPRRVTKAADVMPLDGQRPLLLAGLIGAGRLLLPDHTELVSTFLDTVGRAESFSSQDREQIEAALKQLVSDSNLPPNLRMLARAMRARFAAGDGPDAGLSPPVARPRPRPSGGKGNGGGNRARAAHATPPVGDVDAVTLELD